MSRAWRRIFRPDPRREIDEELAFHLEQRARDYQSRGLDADAARAAASRRLGDLTPVRAECADLLASEQRVEARREWLKFSWLDFKLGFRMLIKYPGLTVVGGFAMAFAILVGAGVFEFVRQVMDPVLPLPDGDRIVRVQNHDAERGRVDRQSTYDFALWREQLETIEDLGAYRTLERNLAIDGAGVEPVQTAEISASAFSVARVRPVIGRTLTDSDEQAGAPLVVVIGHDVWQDRFGGDPGVIGRTVRLGSTPAAVVGVMPEGFGFPVSHNLWLPLRLNTTAFGPREGPPISVFGRLSDGASLREAQAELDAFGTRLAAVIPETHEHLRPRVRAFADADVAAEESVFLISLNFFIILLVVLVCANVALLMFARAATRESEIVVRNALGASRARIITQLLAEALVLGGLAALLGLAVAQVALEWAFTTIGSALMEGSRIPFWFDSTLSPLTILYVVALTILGSVTAGVLPALKVTRGLQSRLRETAVGSGLRFGGIWTAVIVAQVAVTVAFPVVAAFTQRDMVQIREMDVGFPEEQYLSARLEVERESMSGEPLDSAAFADRVRTAYRELEERLRADPRVIDITYADLLPRMYHPHRLVDVDDGGAAPLVEPWPAYRVSSAYVDPEFFDALDVPVVTGRRFSAADLESGHRVVIVNTAFVDRVLGDRNPIGRRLQYAYSDEDQEPLSPDEQELPWYEIIGVVPTMGDPHGFDPKIARVYHPAAPDVAYPLQLGIHVRGDPSTFAARLREHATAVDPTLRVYQPLPMDRMDQIEIDFLRFWVRAISVVSAIALALSMAGIYAVVAFTVARRTREIGIRIALGSSPRRLLAATLRRPLVQVGSGIVAGALLVALLMTGGLGRIPEPRVLAMIAGYSICVMIVCMLACIVPIRRALGVQPTEALKADA